MGDIQTAQRLEEIAPTPAQETNASKNVVALKTNQHVALAVKVARWTAALAQARQSMLDLAVELLDAEQAESKARISYEAASAAHGRRKGFG